MGSWSSTELGPSHAFQRAVADGDGQLQFQRVRQKMAIGETE